MGNGRSHFVRLRGLRFHLRRFGAPEAPLLILLHGWLDTSGTWVEVAAALAEHFDVVVPDQRGYGYSEWPEDGYWFADYLADLDALVDHLAPSAPMMLVGHSMGGQVASLYTGLRPERVAKLAVLDSLFLPDTPAEKAPRRLKNWLDQVKGPPREKTYASFEALAERVQKQHPQLSAERALFVARGWGHANASGEIRLLADPKHRRDMPTLYRNAESEAIWKNITASTLFLDAERSAFAKAILPEQVASRRACFARHDSAVLPAAGHMLHFDAPAETAAALLRFLL